MGTAGGGEGGADARHARQGAGVVRETGALCQEHTGSERRCARTVPVVAACISGFNVR